MRRAIVIAVFPLLLAACGKSSELRPGPGQKLPVKPLMAHVVPTPNQLLTPPAYADPDRVDELMRKSAPRASDRFDLPPPNGGAPDAPIETQDDGASASAEGPVKPT